ncbi:MAG: PcfB family protein [Oscillospiraceae bacterium]
MNQGGEVADQVVRYSLDGTEVVLKLSGLAAKNLGLFLIALLKDQKKSRGKTRILRMVKDGRSTRFFTVPTERMHEFAREAKMRGLLFAAIRDKKRPNGIEIMVFADDAAKANRVMDAMGLDFLGTQSAIMETEKAKTVRTEVKSKTETIKTKNGDVEFETGELEDIFNVSGEKLGDENFTHARENGKEVSATDKIPSERSSRSSDSLQPLAADKGNNEKPSVREALGSIKKEQAQEQKKPAQKSRQSQKSVAAPSKLKTKKQTKGR